MHSHTHLAEQQQLSMTSTGSMQECGCLHDSPQAQDSLFKLYRPNLPTFILISISCTLFLFISSFLLLSVQASQYSSMVIDNANCDVVVSIAHLGTTRYIGCARKVATDPTAGPEGVIWIQPLGQPARIWRNVFDCRPRMVVDEGTGYLWAGCDEHLYIFPPNTTADGSPLAYPYVTPDPIDLNGWECSWAILVAADSNSQSTRSRNARASNPYLDRNGPTIAMGCLEVNNLTHMSYFYISNFNQSTPNVTRVEGPQNCIYGGFNADTDGNSVFLPCGTGVNEPATVLQGANYYSANISTSICADGVWIKYDLAGDRLFLACNSGPVVAKINPVANGTDLTDIIMTAKQCSGPTTLTFDPVTRVFYAMCTGSGLLSFRADYTPSVIPVLSTSDCAPSIFYGPVLNSANGSVAIACSTGVKQFQDGYFSEVMTDAVCSYPSDMYADAQTGDVYQSCLFGAGSLARIRGTTYQALTDPLTSCSSSELYEDMSSGTIVISCVFDDIRAWQQNTGQAPDSASVLIPMSDCAPLEQMLPIPNSSTLYLVCPSNGIYLADIASLTYRMILPNNICSAPTLIATTPAGRFNSTLYVMCKKDVGGGIFAVNHFNKSYTVQANSGNADYNLTLFVPTSRCQPRILVYDAQDSLIIGCGTFELIAYNIRTGVINGLIDIFGTQCTGVSNVKVFDGYLYMLCDEFKGVKTIRIGDYLNPTFNLIDSECTNPTALAVNRRSGTVYTACGGFSATASGDAFQCYEGTQWVYGSCVACPSGTYRNYTTILGKMVNCQQCASGEVSPTTGAQACTVCTPGKYQVSPYIECQDCQIGTYTDVYGAVSCKFCPEGTFGNTTALTTAACSGQCSPGYWCGLGATSPQSLPCGSRSVYCPSGSGRPHPVDPGYYSTNAAVAGTENTMTAQITCDVGQYCDSSGFARPCAPGRFSNHSTAESCDSCEVGRWSDDSRRNSTGGIIVDSTGQPVLGATQCEPCAPGSFTAHTGTITCSLCGPGSSQANSGATVCQDCIPGRSAPESGHSTCPSCSPGRSASDSKSIGCSLCIPGRYAALNGSTSCSPCDAGYFSVDFGAMICDPCGPGRYSQQGAGNVCQQCSQGSASNATALDHVCPPCPPGTSQFTTGQVSCDPCPPKRYSSGYGSLQCVTCPTVTNVERTTCSQSPCDENEQYDSDTGTCTKCGIGFTASKGGTCTACPPNTYTPGIGTGCIDCGQSGMNGLSCANGRISVLDGYWAFQQQMALGERSYMVYQAEQCPEDYCNFAVLQEEYFINSTGLDPLSLAILQSSSVQCIFPRIPSVLCGECAEGYVMQGGSCVECSQANPGLLCLYVILSFAAVVFLLRSAQIGNRAGYSVILLYFAQTAMLEVGPVKGFIRWLRVVNFNAASGTGGSSCLAPLTAYEQYMVSIGMPVILLCELFLIAVIHRALNATRFGKVLSEDESNVGFFTRMLHSMGSEFAWSKYVGGGFAILLFCYTQATSSCIKFLTCVDVGDARVVFFDPSIHCDSPEYKRYMVPILFALSLYVILFPVGVLIFLFIHRRKLADRGVVAAMEKQITGLHLVEMAHGTRASITPSFAAGPVALTPKEASTNGNHNKNSSEPLPPSEKMTVEFIQCFGPLFQAFAPHAWYYQVAVLVRRAFFVICSVVLVSQPQTMGMVYALLNFISVLMQLNIRPFQEKKLNTLEISSLSVLVIISIIITAYTSPYSTATQIVLFFLIVPPIVFFFCLLIQQKAQVLHQKLRRKGSMQLSNESLEKRKPNGNVVQNLTTTEAQATANGTQPHGHEGKESTILDMNRPQQSPPRSNRPPVMHEDITVEMSTLPPPSPTQDARMEGASLAPVSASSPSSLPSPSAATGGSFSPPRSPTPSTYANTAARLRVAIRMLQPSTNPAPVHIVTSTPTQVVMNETAPNSVQL